MKRILTVILCVFTLFLLCSCAKGTSAETSESDDEGKTTSDERTKDTLVEKTEEASEKDTYVEKLSENKPFVIRPMETHRILEICVENEFDGFNYYKAADGEFYFEGAESMFYDVGNSSDEEKSMVDALTSLVCNMISDGEVLDYDRDNMARYGLEDGGKAKLVLTHTNNGGRENTVTVLFGSKTASGNA